MSTSRKQVTAVNPRKSYPLHQCALYRIGSKKRLAKVLEVSLTDLIRLSADEGNFQIFELPEEVCEFTGKRKKARWVQDPVPELKGVLRRIARLLSRVVVPAHCHGATPGRSYRSNALSHVNANAAATFDLKEFFPSTTARQLFAFFRGELLCAPDVAGLLTDLCTYRRILPTGAPSSPILAYWANHRLFDTLDTRGKVQGLTLSVYVDDMTFSGSSVPRSLPDQVEGIVERHHHKLSPGKTKVFAPGRPKHVTGVVIARGKLQVPHARFKKARAIKSAMFRTTDDEQRALLAAKLCGLLGEAAFLDSRYGRAAADSVRILAAAKAKLPKRSPLKRSSRRGPLKPAVAKPSQKLARTDADSDPKLPL